MNLENSYVRNYIESIKNSKGLPKREERELSDRIQNGDTDARNELVTNNLLFVVNIAKNYQNRGLDLMDLISHGNSGIMTAAEKFDGKKGYKFITYAVWWIRQSILQGLANEHYPSIPPNRINDLATIERFYRNKNGENIEFPDTGRMAKDLDMSLDRVEKAMVAYNQINTRNTRLDAQYNENDGDEMYNLFADGDDVEANFEKIDLQKTVEEELNSLNNREKKFLVDYYGIGCEAQTLEEIGRNNGLTRERIRQINARSRKRLNKEKLRDYY